MQWEYKIVALGLIVDATVPKQRAKHEQILNKLGSEGWEAVAYVSQSDTVLLKRAVKQAADSAPSRAAPVIVGRRMDRVQHARIAVVSR